MYHSPVHCLNSLLPSENKTDYEPIERGTVNTFYHNVILMF